MTKAQQLKLGKTLLVVAFVSAICYFTLIFDLEAFDHAKGIRRLLGNASLTLQSYKSDEERLRNSSSQQIFFMESHMSGRRRLDSARQACSIEAAAKTNPDVDVYLLMATNESGVVMDSTPHLSALLTYPNIRIRYVNISEFTKGTPVEAIFRDGTVARSQFALEHTSDILRMLTLNKFGGLYMDLDVLSLFPVRLINRANFVCIEDALKLANAIMKFDRITGKKYSDKYLEMVAKTYDPNNWIANGPILATSAIKSFCKDIKLNANETMRCDEITLLASRKCFPFMYQEFSKLYEPQSTSAVLEILTQSGSYFIHVWNKMLSFERKQYDLAPDSGAAYVEVARVYCPKTFAVGSHFR